MDELGSTPVMTNELGLAPVSSARKASEFGSAPVANELGLALVSLDSE